MNAPLFIVILMFCLWIYYHIQNHNKTATIRTKGIDDYRLRVQKMLRERHEPLIKKEPETTSIPTIPIITSIPETLSPVYELEYTNIAGKVDNPTKWWQCQHKDLPAPSSAEQLIIDELSLYSVVWHREVEFAGLKVNKYSYPRYDFFLPEYMLILEYDGRSSHSNPHQVAMDKLKDKFCKKNGIRVIRYNSKHYYKMSGTIMTLMKEYKIKRKIPR